MRMQHIVVVVAEVVDTTILCRVSSLLSTSTIPRCCRGISNKLINISSWIYC